jgi:hypothetical protein
MQSNRFEKAYRSSIIHKLIQNYDFYAWSFIDKIGIFPSENSVNLVLDASYKKNLIKELISNVRENVLLNINFKDIIEIFASYQNKSIERDRLIDISNEWQQDLEIEVFNLSYEETAVYYPEEDKLDMVYLLKIKAENLLIIFTFRNLEFTEIIKNNLLLK